MRIFLLTVALMQIFFKIQQLFFSSKEERFTSLVTRTDRQTLHLCFVRYAIYIYYKVQLRLFSKRCVYTHHTYKHFHSGRKQYVRHPATVLQSAAAPMLPQSMLKAFSDRQAASFAFSASPWLAHTSYLQLS